jgi:hypothetical protein
VRSVVTPEGQLYVLGGYLPLLKYFVQNTFILDEHRQTLVPIQRMIQGRSDFAVIYRQNKIYIFGGMTFKDESKE